jgi:hypothetical protein
MMRYAGVFFLASLVAPCGADAATLRCVAEAKTYGATPTELSYEALENCVKFGTVLTTPVLGAPKATLSMHDSRLLYNWLGQFTDKWSDSNAAVILQWDDPASFSARGKVEDGQVPIIEFKSQM